MAEYFDDKSVFNMAIAMLRRLDALLTNCAIAKGTMNFPVWFDNLRTLSGEINYMFKKEAIEKEDAFVFLINPLVDEFNTKMIYNNKSERFELRANHTFDDYSLLHMLLVEYDKFLRTELSNRDMLVATKEDVRRAVERF